ncbi:MAG TPA: VWA domain-containing protein [Polyangiaceae bacterium]|jgi:Ca-activated chloride channel family protein|nr:VWA domain-containing protein [Polyangiaceae bacterium]
MIHFQHPWVLLLLVPLFAIAWWLGRAGRPSAITHSNTELVLSVSKVRRSRWGRLWPLLRWMGAALFVVALARPNVEHHHANVRASGVDIMLAVDVSGSMQARDMLGPNGATSRLDAAKEVVGRFVRDRTNDRIGLVAFAGQPYLVSPLTLDHDWVLQRLQSLDASAAGDGTAIGSAIASGVRRLDAHEAKSKLLVLLTDGQNNAGKITPAAAGEAARALGVKVYTIGVGSAGEALVPLTDQRGQEQLVKARVDVDEASMKRIADITGGAFYRATDTKSLQNVYAAIDRSEKTTHTLTAFTTHDERFAWFAIPGLLLVLGELGLSATRFRRIPC